MVKTTYISYNLFKKILNFKQKGSINTWSRSSTILPDFLDKIINLHNGKKHFPIRITKSFFFQHDVLLKHFHKFGEFNLTRFFKSHKIIDKKIKKKKNENF